MGKSRGISSVCDSMIVGRIYSLPIQDRHPERRAVRGRRVGTPGLSTDELLNDMSELGKRVNVTRVRSRLGGGGLSIRPLQGQQAG